MSTCSIVQSGELGAIGSSVGTSMSAPAMRPTASVSISGDHGRTPPQRSKKVVAAARRGRNGAAPRVSVTASTAGGPVELLPALKRQPRGMAQPTPRSLRNDRAGHRRGAVSAARRVQRTLARRVLFPAMSLSLRAIRCRSASARVRGGGIERLPGTQRVEQLAASGHDVLWPPAALIGESFTPRLRYSGASLGCQLASMNVGGPSPIATALFATFS
jgi:hypothetical protein